MNNDMCGLAERLYSDTFWQFGQLQQIVGGVCGALPMAYFLVASDKMPQIFTRLPKILIRWMMAFILVHDVCLIAVTTWHILLRLGHKSACDLLLVSWKCVLLRAVTTACVSGMTCVYFLTTVDALCQIYLPQRYHRCASGKAVSIVIVVAIMLFIVISTLTVFYDEDLFEQRIYCYEASLRTRGRLGQLHALLLVVDVACTFRLFFLIKRLFRGLQRNKHEFVVCKKVEMRSNIAAVRFLVASTLLRCVFVWPLLLGGWLVRRNAQNVPAWQYIRIFQFLAGLYIIQWYGSAFAFILYYWRPFRIRHRIRVAPMSTSEQRNIHFTELGKQWR